MKSTVHAILAAFILAAIPTTLWAQWPPYPSPGVPKLADGKPNMEGPTPRTADGKPDFSGIWQFEGKRRRPPATPGVIAGSGPGPAHRPRSACAPVHRRREASALVHAHPASANSSTSAPPSRAAFHSRRGQLRCGKNARTTTIKTIPMRTVCLWASRNCTCIRSLEKSFRRPN